MDLFFWSQKTDWTLFFSLEWQHRSYISVVIFELLSILCNELSKPCCKIIHLDKNHSKNPTCLYMHIKYSEKKESYEQMIVVPETTGKPASCEGN